MGMDKLKYDTKEFEKLFADTCDPKKKIYKTKSKRGDKSKQNQRVQIIDGKRGMMGSIVLARIKISFPDIAKMVNEMDAKDLDAVQLEGLKEFLPFGEEAAALKQHLQQASSEEAKKEALKVLNPCENYMAVMMDVQNAEEKLDVMIFNNQFQSRLHELNDEVNKVVKACKQIRSSKKLRTIFAIILAVGNQINTSGSGNVAAGFNLEAVLKLDETKAFDKKTNVLQYFVKLVKINDESLLNFKEEIDSVEAAAGVVITDIEKDIKIGFD